MAARVAKTLRALSSDQQYWHQELLAIRREDGNNICECGREIGTTKVIQNIITGDKRHLGLNCCKKLKIQNAPSCYYEQLFETQDRLHHNPSEPASLVFVNQAERNGYLLPDDMIKYKRAAFRKVLLGWFQEWRQKVHILLSALDRCPREQCAECQSREVCVVQKSNTDTLALRCPNGHGRFRYVRIRDLTPYEITEEIDSDDEHVVIVPLQRMMRMHDSRMEQLAQRHWEMRERTHSVNH